LNDIADSGEKVSTGDEKRQAHTANYKGANQPPTLLPPLGVSIHAVILGFVLGLRNVTEVIFISRLGMYPRFSGGRPESRRSLELRFREGWGLANFRVHFAA
jgi:hypothetical protein